MGLMTQILSLFFIAITVTSSAVEEHHKRKHEKSRLILEYNWPVPNKNLNRLPDPRSCHHFYHIKADGSHAMKKCHEDKIFDYRSLQCKEKSSAKCWKNIVKKGNMKKVKRHFSCPFPWGLYPDKEDCSMFYDCLGGKVYPRKCPDYTLFDKVERTCVHNKKAVCAVHSGKGNLKAGNPLLVVLFERPRGQDYGKDKSGHQLDKSVISEHDQSDNQGESRKVGHERDGFSGHNTVDLEDVAKVRSIPQSQLSVQNTASVQENISTERSIFVTSGTLDFNFKENSSEDEKSSEEVDKKNRIKFKVKPPPPKISFTTATVMNTKLFETTETNFKDNSSEEENASEEREHSPPKPESRSVFANVLDSFDNALKKTQITKVISTPSIMLNSKEHKTLSSHGDESAELPLNSAKTADDKELQLKPITVSSTSGSFPTSTGKDINISDIEKISMSPETTSRELPPASNHFIHKESNPTEKTSFISDSVAFHRQTTDSPSTIFCPDSDGYFRHPNDKHKYITCIAGRPTVMECPKYLIYDTKMGCS